jgi:hypothetical protein
VIAYGIANETSDMRVHVSVCTDLAYIFETEAMRKFIASNGDFLRRVRAYQFGVSTPTAYGLLVPLRSADFVTAVSYSGIEDSKPSQDWSTTKKGAWAASIVACLANLGRLPLYIRDASEHWSREVQISGTDVIVSESFRIQTKCDWRASPTGNLFIQTHEANPRGMH